MQDTVIHSAQNISRRSRGCDFHIIIFVSHVYTLIIRSTLIYIHIMLITYQSAKEVSITGEINFADVKMKYSAVYLLDIHTYV